MALRERLDGVFTRCLWAPDPSPLYRPLLGVLAAASYPYRWGAAWDRRRQVRRRKRLPVPVISVGNLVVGGSGKTPLAAWLARELAAMGRRPAVLLRGYGVPPARDPVLLRPGEKGEEGTSGREAVSDEALWLAGCAGVLAAVHPDRYRAGMAACREAGADVVVLDDGYQHHRLHRDLDMLLVDGRAGWGNGRLLPRGQLREPLDQAARAHVVVFTRLAPGEDPSAEARAPLGAFPRERIFTARYLPDRVDVFPGGERCEPGWLVGRRVAAFCGIARPRGFFDVLRGLGAVVEEELPLGDHQRYGAAERERIEAFAAAGLLPVTTEKDAVKLAGADWPGSWAALGMRVEMDRREDFLEIVADALREAA